MPAFFLLLALLFGGDHALQLARAEDAAADTSNEQTAPQQYMLRPGAEISTAGRGTEEKHRIPCLNELILHL